MTVSMEPSYHDDPVIHTATLRCNFCVNDATFDFFNLEWKKDGVLVADYSNGAATPNYADFCASSGDCTITRTCSESYFTIASLDRSQNNAVFSCEVVFDKGAQRKSGDDTTTLIVTGESIHIQHNVYMMSTCIVHHWTLYLKDLGTCCNTNDNVHIFTLNLHRLRTLIVESFPENCTR